MGEIKVNIKDNKVLYSHWNQDENGITLNLFESIGIENKVSDLKYKKELEHFLDLEIIKKSLPTILNFIDNSDLDKEYLGVNSERESIKEIPFHFISETFENFKQLDSNKFNVIKSILSTLLWIDTQFKSEKIFIHSIDEEMIYFKFLSSDNISIPFTVRQLHENGVFTGQIELGVHTMNNSLPINLQPKFYLIDSKIGTVDEAMTEIKENIDIYSEYMSILVEEKLRWNNSIEAYSEWLGNLQVLSYIPHLTTNTNLNFYAKYWNNNTSGYFYFRYSNLDDDEYLIVFNESKEFKIKLHEFGNIVDSLNEIEINILKLLEG